ncbi:MAG: vitamin K epoxide reductase family protein [Desulfocapsaceae bacterium]|nr:vitamin K epoxide reductase family protein [Desulfocapsaceae bacterium]
MNPISTGHKEVLPYRYYSIPVFLLLLLGLADTAYLAYSHYKNYTDITFSSFCALSKSINCDTVSQSPWSILLGIPIAFWGFLAYSLFLIIFLATLRKSKESETLWHLLFILGLVDAIAAVYFGYISAIKIKAYCILCLASYGISFSLFFYCWIILSRFCRDSFWIGLKKGVHHLFSSWLLRGSIIALMAIFLCFKIYVPPYWQYTFPPSSTEISNGHTEEGNPWIGSKTPEITIHEYTDYQCFQCSKMHQFLRRLIAEHPGKIKLIHHHYPMDHEFNNIIVPKPFHIGSGKMAMIGIYAASKNKFWEMNDALYAIGREKQPFNTRTLSKMTGFSAGELAAATRHPQIREALLYDIRQGMKLGITGTPTFVINGKAYQGSIPAEILQTIIP